MSQFDGRKSLWTLQWKFFWIYFAAVTVEAKAFYTKGQFCSSWTNFAISGRKSERALKDINIKAKCQPFNPLKIERKWKFFFNSILAAITFIMTIFFQRIILSIIRFFNMLCYVYDSVLKFWETETNFLDKGNPTSANWCEIEMVYSQSKLVVFTQLWNSSAKKWCFGFYPVAESLLSLSSWEMRLKLTLKVKYWPDWLAEWCHKFTVFSSTSHSSSDVFTTHSLTHCLMVSRLSFKRLFWGMSIQWISRSCWKCTYDGGKKTKLPKILFYTFWKYPLWFESGFRFRFRSHMLWKNTWNRFWLIYLSAKLGTTGGETIQEKN